MPRKQSERTTVWALYRRIATDKKCPWILQMHALDRMAIMSGTIAPADMPPLPGTKRVIPESVSNPSSDISKDAPTVEEAAAARGVEEVKNFIRGLTEGGANVRDVEDELPSNEGADGSVC